MLSFASSSVRVLVKVAFVLCRSMCRRSHGDCKVSKTSRVSAGNAFIESSLLDPLAAEEHERQAARPDLLHRALPFIDVQRPRSFD
jgi:hypothetical protein